MLKVFSFHPKIDSPRISVDLKFNLIPFPHTVVRILWVIFREIGGLFLFLFVVYVSSLNNNSQRVKED